MNGVLIQLFLITVQDVWNFPVNPHCSQSSLLSIVQLFDSSAPGQRLEAILNSQGKNVCVW